ncbi:hypothetical protein L1049_000324 [Liquidambar formosana]|uniref:NB-ARC domain-containing protein n=1 Tax=Liquidambar formosana TaxID=63359 RepID=A0AAP0N8S1_LIQFO
MKKRTSISTSKLVVGRVRPKDHSVTGYILDNSDVVGREDDKERIIDLLLSDDSDVDGVFSVIPIIGMGGLGKTTLARLVYEDDRIRKKFDPRRMWASVSNHFDLKMILKNMMESNSKMKYNINLSIRQLQSIVSDFLSNKKDHPFLLVLDDVWTENYGEWETLQGVFKNGGKGSKVLVTTRNEGVANLVGTRSEPFRLSSLPEDQCWSLFGKIAFTPRNSSSGAREELEKIGRGIVSKCDGLPLAVKAMGGLLRGDDSVEKWRNILTDDVWETEQNILTDDVWETEQNSGTTKLEILPALKLSYDHLPIHLKQCFTYCSIFPKAHVFDKKQLVQLWTAEAFIQTKEPERLDKIGNLYFDELLGRSFFLPLNADKQKYKMHDLIHDLAQSISNPHCCQVMDNVRCGISDCSRHVSLLCTDVQRYSLEIIDKSKKVRTLLLPSEYPKDFGQALDKMFHTLRYMRSLDLSSSTISELPTSVEELKLLRYLDLSKTGIKMLPNSICNLSNLQTLKLLRCLWLFELPKDLGNVINLRHLELDDMFWYKFSTVPPRMGRLINLHNLHAFPVGPDQSGYGIDELKGMVCLTGTLHISKLENVANAGEANLKEKESLLKVVFEWSDRGDVDPQDEAAAEQRVLEDLQPHSNIEELQICHFRGSRIPTWMRNGLLQNLECVSLNHCKKWRILSLGQLPHLHQLSIKGMQDLEEWQEGEFDSQLYRLKISNCPKLRKLPNLFHYLQSLKIKKCNSLKALPVTPSLQSSILVDNLELEDWNETTIVCSLEYDQGQAIHHGILPTFIKLLKLKIINCPKLQALPVDFAPAKLEIDRCELMSTLPVPELAQYLQQMTLCACPDTLVRKIPKSENLFTLVISNISNLISLPRWPHLPKLESLYIHDCKDLLSLAEEEEEEEGSLRSLTSLTLLSIRNCPKLVTLPTRGLPTTLECLIIGLCPELDSLGPKEMMKSLTSLKDLYIEDCPKLESLPEDGLPTSLQHLRIHECPLLTERCREKDGGGPDWPKIMHIRDLEIESTKIPSPETASSSTWYHRFWLFGGIKTREPGEPQRQINSTKRVKREGK